MGTVVVIYIVGIVVAIMTYRIRAGLGVWARYRIFGPDGVGLEWTALTAAKGFGWPVVFAVWLASGRPEPRIVYNDRAVERSYGRAGATPEQGDLYKRNG